MKNILSILLLALIAGLTSCGTSQEITGSWINKEAVSQNRNYQKVLIAVLSGSLDAKMTVENDLSKAATAYGVKNIKALDIFPPNVSMVDTSLLIQKIKEHGCDAIFTVALLKHKTETQYVPGTTSYVPSYGYGYGGAYYGGAYGGYSAYGGYYRSPYGYYNYMGTTVSTPGYYTEESTYYLEGNLFDANTNELLYSIQSTAYNPSDIATESAVYTTLVFDRMAKDGLITKPAK
ncbi:MAG: hypothetical protein IPG01_04810 [Chitinophagaceae bacterium]|nr:hypothetical protein [Chitinophagaceae bacterium]